MGEHSRNMADLRASSEFDLVDTDKSGTISRAEYEAAYGTFRTEAEFDQADTNKDGELSRQEYVAAYGTMGHFHLYTRSYHLGLPALAALLVSAAVREAAIHGHFLTIWTLLPIFAACLALLMWFALRWMVPTVDWLADNPFSEARVQNPGSGPVRFVWSDTACGRRLPMLQIIEPKDENERRAVAVEMGRLLAPFAHEARWALRVFSVALNALVPEGMVDTIRATLPDEMIEELEGYMTGLQEGLPPSSFLKSWTVDDLLMLQLLPDLKTLLSSHNPKQTRLRHALSRVAAKKDAVGVVGCSSIVSHNGMYRNMDWLSLGCLGTYTLLVKRVYPSGAVSIEVSVPMLLGTVSGVIDRNDGTPRALIAMNVTNPCDEYSWDVDGSRMPAGYYNRLLMRAGARDGENVMQWKPNCTPLGPYHLTIGQNTSGNTDLISKFEGQVTHFHQGKQPGEHVTRKLTSELPFVLTCNGNYRDRTDEQQGTYLVTNRNPMHTNERTRRIRNSGLAPRDGVGALQLPEVNNFETVYAVVLEKNEITLRVNNGFAATAPPVTFPAECFKAA